MNEHPLCACACASTLCWHRRTRLAMLACCVHRICPSFATCCAWFWYQPLCRNCPLLSSPPQSKGRKEAGPGAAGEVPLSEEELREQQKRRMLFGQSWPAAAPKAPQQAQQQAQAQQQQQQQPGGGGGGTAAAASPAHAAGGEGRASGPGSAGVSPRGSGHAEAAAAPGEIYGSLSAAASAAGPLASGAFGSRLGSLELPAPPLHPEDSGSMAPGSSSGRGGQADPAAAALLGGPPGGGSGGGSGRAGLTTPRWAKSLASGAKKGLAKAKEALRDSLQE